MFDPTFGFFLLPNTVGPGRFIAQDINENGDVLGVYYVNVNGNYSDDHIFFWTPLNLGESTLLLPGLTRSDGITVMNDDFFAAYLKEGANVNTGLDWRLYSYTVQSDGAFDCQLDSDLPMVFTLGAISRNSLLPFNQWLEGGVGEEGLYRLGIYDAVTRQATTFAPCSWRGVGNANLSGDILHAGPDNSLRLYRHADVVHERVVCKIRDLLEESARTDFDAVSTISRRSQVNSSNVCCVPVDNPFDHIAVNSMSPSGGYQRAFMLTPIAK
jgi:hypothetical protein